MLQSVHMRLKTNVQFQVLRILKIMLAFYILHK